MVQTKNLSMTLLEQFQLSKEIVLNDNLNILDKLCNCGAIDLTINIPTTVMDGDIYIVGPNANNNWTGKDNNLAVYFTNAGWKFFAPNEGRLCFVQSSQNLFVFTKKTWKKLI